MPSQLNWLPVGLKCHQMYRNNAIKKIFFSIFDDILAPLVANSVEKPQMRAFHLESGPFCEINMV